MNKPRLKIYSICLIRKDGSIFTRYKEKTRNSPEEVLGRYVDRWPDIAMEVIDGGGHLVAKHTPYKE
jgi:hypothetical protein